MNVHGLFHSYGDADEQSAADHETAHGAGGREPHMNKADKNPHGGLTAKGRAKYNKATGGDLKPGVKGAADTPEKMKRKGSFLRRHYAKDAIPPLKKPDGEPTRFALQANAWGEAVPKTEADVRRLAAKGAKLLERYHSKKD